MPSWFELPRVPEAEVMAKDEETEAYLDGTATSYLDRLDDTFVEHALRLNPLPKSVLDIGTGPGQIPIKLAKRCAAAEIIGVDMSDAMLAKARLAATKEGVAERARFQKADGKKLPFDDARFDLVVCNSVLHHATDPVLLLREINRVTKPSGAFLLRDLRRPSRAALPLHVRWHGRFYSGKMCKLYDASVRAAYTVDELDGLLEKAGITGAIAAKWRSTHIIASRKPL